jgi:hypothetical protein
VSVDFKEVKELQDEETKALLPLGMVNAYNPRTQEADTGGSQASLVQKMRPPSQNKNSIAEIYLDYLKNRPVFLM